MKFQSLSKVSLFFSCFIFCFLFIAPLSRAEQSDDGLSNQGVAAEGLRTLKGSQQEKGIEPVVQPVSIAKDMASSYDVKFSLSERFKAVLSFGKSDIGNPGDRDTGKNYSATFGFQIVLQ